MDNLSLINVYTEQDSGNAYFQVIIRYITKK